MSHYYHPPPNTSGSLPATWRAGAGSVIVYAALSLRGCFMPTDPINHRPRQARVTAVVCGLAVVAATGLTVALVSPASGPQRPARHDRTVPGGGHVRPGPVAVTATRLPPAGTGPLLLSLLEVQRQNPYWELAMTRLGRRIAPAALPSPPAWADAQATIATDPAGGWVVSYATRRASALGEAPQRLATVATSGQVQPFGPSFAPQLTVTALAVRPDGSAVAVALSDPDTRTRPAQIEVVPLPGHPGADRTWTLAAPGWVRTMAESLSWAPGGTRLTYIAGGDETGGGFAGDGAVTLDTSAPGSIAPSASKWPPFRKGKGQCSLRAGAWQISTGRYLALEQCQSSVVVVAANPANGADVAPAVQLPEGPNTTYWGCGQPAIDPAPSGREVLISGCGLYLYSPAAGRIGAVPGPLAGATFWGGAPAPVAVRFTFLGNGVGGATFGQPEAIAIAELDKVLGSPATPRPAGATGNCTVDAYLTWPALTAYFFRGRFVGYNSASLVSQDSAAPHVLANASTAAGLRVGDDVTQARQMYGRAFVVLFAQGGSWRLRTSAGTLDGYLTGVPGTRPAPRVADVSAGSVGCPAVSP
jgi:hypothetical protein